MNHHSHDIDLTTVEDVQRLLSTTTFATVDDLIGRGEPLDLDHEPAPRRAEALSAPPEGAAVLPRRR